MTFDFSPGTHGLNSTSLTEIHQDNIAIILRLRKHFDRNLNRVNSVKPSSAQTAALCEMRKLQELNQTIQNVLQVQNAFLPNYVKAIIELQFLYGLRIGEALKIDYSCILFNGQIKVQGAKSSENRFVYPVKYLEFWNHIRKNQIIIPPTFDRFYFYRLYKRLGIFQIMGKNKNNSVTHSLRYMFILQLLDDGENIEAIKEIIGHKSINSTMHYISNLYEN